MGGPPAVSDAIASATPFRLHPGCVWDSEDFKEEGNLTPSWMLSCCEYLFFLEEQLRDSEAGEPEPNSKRARTQEPSVTISLLDEIHIDLYTDEDVASMDIIGDDPFQSRLRKASPLLPATTTVVMRCRSCR